MRGMHNKTGKVALTNFKKSGRVLTDWRIKCIFAEMLVLWLQ